MTVDERGESPVYSYILRARHHYFVGHVKAPLMNGLINIATLPLRIGFVEKLVLLKEVWHIVRSVYRYPYPTKENTKKHDTHALIDLWDEFFNYDTNVTRRPLFLALRRISCCEVEHDNHYSQRITWFMKRAAEKYMLGEWNPLQEWCPMQEWNDPKVIEAVLKAREEFQKYLTVGGVPIGEIET